MSGTFVVLIFAVGWFGYWMGYHHGYDNGESAEWWRDRIPPDHLRDPARRGGRAVMQRLAKPSSRERRVGSIPTPSADPSDGKQP